MCCGLPGVALCANNIDIGGRILFDARNHIHSDQSSDARIHSIDDFELRTMRFEVNGGNPEATRVKFSVEYSSGESNVKDAYLNRLLGKSVQFRIGQFHVPFGNESLGSSRFQLFQEDSTISDALSASRDVGAMLHGSLFSKHTYFQLGYMNGSGANVSDNNDSKDYAMRLVFRPFFTENDEVNLWLGFSFTTGEELSTGSDRIKLETESNSGYTYFRTSIPEGVSYNRNRYDFEYTLLVGAFLLKGEFLRTTYFDSGTYVEGGYIASSYILSGEKHRIRNGLLYRQISKESTDKHDDSSAIGFALRYSWFKVANDFFTDNSLFDGWQGVSSEDYSKSGKAVTFALNWYINRETRFIANWIFSFADVADPQQPDKTITKQVETSLTTRLQVDF